MEYTGIKGSEGIVMGRVLVYGKESISIVEELIDEKHIPMELCKVEAAIQTSREQIARIKEQASMDFSGEEAAIFDAHLMILEDPELMNGIRDAITIEKLHASMAASRTIESFAAMFSAIEDEYLRERAADIRDVGSRLIRNILGAPLQDIGKLSSDVIIAAHDLTPSDTALMDKNHVKGFITDIGGRTSHTAIMARSLEIPAVLGLGDITEKVRDGSFIIVDGNQGKVIVDPDEAEVLEYKGRIEEHNRKKCELKKLSGLSSVTLDGKAVELAANIGGPSDAASVIEHGGDGVGLFRTEFLYMDRDSLPDEEEQYEAYKAAAEKLAGKPVIIRTLDIGGDKKLSYLPVQEEMNPFLGFRAIRLCLEHEEIFKTQLRAILRASIYKNILIMYPMISGVDEVIEANRLLDEAKCELREKGIEFDEDIKCGVMIEIPSAAITADLIIREVDFFSIGTNDLCQYSMAVDRMNEKVAGLYQPFHPAVLRLIKNVIDEAHKAGKFAGMCGELAGEPAAAMLLLGLGLDEFSMSPSSLPFIKKIIRSVSAAEAEKVAAHALTLSTPSQVQGYCEQELKKLDIGI
ncbi:MAG TPA: phosphoenolpyruvate--protein phosphotransferase [Negativicutes bacterium]|nr:phosphoenolpyruvate--protein phosphotransferase [Negativicutes bacterium]